MVSQLAKKLRNPLEQVSLGERGSGVVTQENVPQLLELRRSPQYARETATSCSLLEMYPVQNHTTCRLLKEKLFNFEILHIFIQRTCIVF
jgi:hypothetical protein